MLYGPSNHIIILTKKVFQEEDINLPKVPLTHIFTAPEKCPPKREKEAPEDESGIDGFTLLASTQCASHLPILKENEIILVT